MSVRNWRANISSAFFQIDRSDARDALSIARIAWPESPVFAGRARRALCRRGADRDSRAARRSAWSGF
ncbi:MAG: hypothetical protein ABIV04_08300 [Massilia sp.]